MIEITPALQIDERELQIEFIRASGPGGQNVNKVATAVQLRFDMRAAPLPEDVKQRLIHLAGNRMTGEGTLVIEAKRFRTQEQNRQDAIERLKALIQRASVAPKIRRATSPTRASQERRLDSKRRRAKVKELRREAGDL